MIENSVVERKVALSPSSFVLSTGRGRVLESMIIRAIQDLVFMERCLIGFRNVEQDALWKKRYIVKLFAAALRHRRDEEGDRRLFNAPL